ncbi:MAG: hypothetical protein IKH75_12455 [Ruminococcus sp.]|nr:hypothetical protein [Ruminococcus sp.]
MKLCEKTDVINNASVRIRERKHIVSVTQIAQLFFLLFLLIKPFYLQRSGTLQIGDFLLGLSFLTYFSCHKFIIDEKDKLLVGFLLSTVLINGIYTLILGKNLMISSLYYLFNYMVISCFRAYSKDVSFLENIRKLLCLNIIIQVVLYFSGIGEYWHGTYRYIGSYNDPNQLGFAVISAFFILCLLKEKYIIVYFIMTAFLIYKTYSTGMLITLLIVSAFYAIYFFRQFAFVDQITIKKQYIVIMLIAIAVILGILIYNNKLVFDINFDRFRIDNKIHKGLNIVESFLADRNMMIITEYPVFFLFGFGEGAFNRYVGYHGELHSTMIATCYYYGIVPYTMFVLWIWRNIKNSSKSSWPVFIALIAEAFTLINHRQPTFWMIFILMSIMKENNDTSVNYYRCIRIRNNTKK